MPFVNLYWVISHSEIPAIGGLLLLIPIVLLFGWLIYDYYEYDKKQKH